MGAAIWSAPFESFSQIFQSVSSPSFTEIMGCLASLIVLNGELSRVAQNHTFRHLPPAGGIASTLDSPVSSVVRRSKEKSG